MQKNSQPNNFFSFGNQQNQWFFGRQTADSGQLVNFISQFYGWDRNRAVLAAVQALHLSTVANLAARTRHPQAQILVNHANIFKKAVESVYGPNIWAEAQKVYAPIQTHIDNIARTNLFAAVQASVLTQMSIAALATGQNSSLLDEFISQPLSAFDPNAVNKRIRSVTQEDMNRLRQLYEIYPSVGRAAGMNIPTSPPRKPQGTKPQTQHSSQIRPGLAGSQTGISATTTQVNTTPATTTNTNLALNNQNFAQNTPFILNFGKSPNFLT